MYNYIKGKVTEKIKNNKDNICVVESNGFGLDIIVSSKTFNKILENSEIKLYIVEISSGIYNSGLPNLFGFLTREEKEIFLAFKDNLSNVGPKKALDYLDKVTQNINEFRKAIRTQDIKILTSLFGFRNVSAQKIINSLQLLANTEFNQYNDTHLDIVLYEDLISALINLGYKDQLSKLVCENIFNNPENKMLLEKKDLSELLKLAFKEISIIDAK